MPDRRTVLRGLIGLVAAPFALINRRSSARVISNDVELFCFSAVRLNDGDPVTEFKPVHLTMRKLTVQIHMLPGQELGVLD